MSDPEGRKTLRNSLRGFPERVYPVGNLEYAASGVILLTNDGDLAAELLKNWEHLEQAYHVKVKGMLTLHDLDHLGKEAGVRMKTLRQPDSTRGRAANYWYEVRMRDTRKEELRRVLYESSASHRKMDSHLAWSHPGGGHSARPLPRAEEIRTRSAAQSRQPRTEARSLYRKSRLCAIVLTPTCEATTLPCLSNDCKKLSPLSGVASRRKAEELIAAHRVTLNGEVVTELGTKADPERDKISIDGTPLPRREQFLYFALYKPKGYVTTVNDPQGRPTVMDLMRGRSRARLSRRAPRLRQ